MWQTCCAELSIDGQPLLRDLPGYETLLHATKLMTPVAFTEAEAQAYVQEIAGPQARVGSLTEAVAEICAYLASQLAEWS